MKSKNKAQMFFVYILRTTDNRFYVGQTNNLSRRMKEHSRHNPNSIHYVQSFSDYHFLYSEHYPNRSQAVKREAELKTWSHSQKSALIFRDIAQLDALK